MQAVHYYKCMMCVYLCFAVPENIECGSCLAGGVREMVLQVENTGGEGRFCLRHSDTHKHQVRGKTNSIMCVALSGVISLPQALNMCA